MVQKTKTVGKTTADSNGATEQLTKYQSAWYNHIDDLSRLNWSNPTQEDRDKIKQIQQQLKEIVNRIDATTKEAN